MEARVFGVATGDLARQILSKGWNYARNGNSKERTAVKVLVAGDSGFVGQNLSDLLERKGHVVVRRSRRDGFNLQDIQVGG